MAADPTPERITSLLPHQVFVFGSNGAGAHGDGAARVAHERFGASWGVGHGPTGASYAIDTMDGDETLARDAADFLAYAEEHPELEFLLTPVGCEIAGGDPARIAPLFGARPVNVRLPRLFLDALGEA